MSSVTWQRQTLKGLGSVQNPSVCIVIILNTMRMYFHCFVTVIGSGVIDEVIIRIKFAPTIVLDSTVKDKDKNKVTKSFYWQRFFKAMNSLKNTHVNEIHTKNTHKEIHVVWRELLTVLSA